MSVSKFLRIGMLFVLFLMGGWILFRPTGVSPETVARQDAVNLALAPGRAGGSNAVDAASDDIEIVQGDPVSPAVVNMSDIPSGPAEVDELEQRYLAGELDFEVNSGPLSDSAYAALIRESMQQGVDKTVQVYDSPLAPEALSSGTNFKSIDYTQSQQGVPPDPDIIVGRDHIIVGVNTSFQVFDKNGNSLVGPTLYSTFWGANCGTGSGMTFFDPYGAYDEENNRYVMGITAYDSALNGGDNGWACVAVSQTDSATGSWYLYSFDGNPGTGTDYFFDYPHIGIGQDAIYISANMFGASFVRNHVMALQKDVMYSGGSASYIKLNVGSANFTLQPAKLKGYLTGGWPTNASEPHYFVDAQYGNSQTTLTVWRLSNPWTSPTIASAGTVTVNSYSLPVSQPQLGSTGQMQGNDNRLLDVEYWNGRLWTTHAIGCNPGSGTVNCVRWYEINISSGTPSLVQQGTLSSNSTYRSFPDLGVDACGNMLVGYSMMSSSMYPSIYVAGREVGDAAGTLKSETLLKAGEDFYTAYDTSPRRWGDYTGMALDPNGTTFWYVGEYSRNQATARWSTWVGSFSWGCNVGPTPTPGPTATATNTPTPTNTPGPSTCVTYTSTDVPKSISSGAPSSSSSVLNVSGTSGTITDVDVVNLNGTHTYINDLDFNLIAPSTTAVQIMAQSCGSQDNFALGLDDEAAPGAWPCPPTGGGNYQPSNPLSAFDGQSANGTWTLRIDDNANLDGGSLAGWGLEICTDGVAPTPTNTPPPSSNTGLLSPSANAAVTSSAGDNNGFQTSPTNAYANDSVFAVDTNSGTGTSTSCTSTAKDKHLYYNYNVSLPGSAVIDGIEVRLDGRVDSTSGTPRFCVQLSWDGGVTWTTAKTSATLTTSEATYTLGGAADNWGRTWSVANFSNANLRVRIIPIASSTARDFSLDWVALQVTYH